MDEVYDREALLTREELAAFLPRDNARSTIRLAIHLATIALLVVATVDAPNLLSKAIALFAASFAVGTIFAPFHECTHSTAFRSATLNRVGVIVTGVLFGTSWHYYRAFHYQHHAHTQDPERDPEIMQDPIKLSPWPTNLVGWLKALTGVTLLLSKIRGMVTSWLPGKRRLNFASLPEQARIDSIVISLFWFTTLALGALGNPYAITLLAAFVLGHFTQGLWLTAEHTGCSETGSIVERTRSMRSNALMRFFTWNMNYHTEHHAWPGVPWHALPRLHRAVHHAIPLEPSYLKLYLDQMRSSHDRLRETHDS